MSRRKSARNNVNRELPVGSSGRGVSDSDSVRTASGSSSTVTPSDSFFYRPYERTLIQRVIDAAEALRPLGTRTSPEELSRRYVHLWSALDDLEIHRRGKLGPGTPRPLLDGWVPPTNNHSACDTCEPKTIPKCLACSPPGKYPGTYVCTRDKGHKDEHCSRGGILWDNETPCEDNPCVIDGCDNDHAGEYALCPDHLHAVVEVSKRTANPRGPEEAGTSCCEPYAAGGWHSNDCLTHAEPGQDRELAIRYCALDLVRVVLDVTGAELDASVIAYFQKAIGSLVSRTETASSDEPVQHLPDGTRQCPACGWEPLDRPKQASVVGNEDIPPFNPVGAAEHDRLVGLFQTKPPQSPDSILDEAKGFADRWDLTLDRRKLFLDFVNQVFVAGKRTERGGPWAELIVNKVRLWRDAADGSEEETRAAKDLLEAVETYDGGYEPPQGQSKLETDDKVHIYNGGGHAYVVDGPYWRVKSDQGGPPQFEREKHLTLIYRHTPKAAKASGKP